jgi:hypothetical protein
VTEYGDEPTGVRAQETVEVTRTVEVTQPTTGAGTGGTHALPPRSSGGEEYFNSSRMKVIGLITAGVVAVGALGGVAGVVFDSDDQLEQIEDPEVGSSALAPGGAGVMGNSVAVKRQVKKSWGLPSSGESESPTPVGSATPESESPSPGTTTSASPSSETSSASPEPSPSPSPDGGGEGVTMADGTQIYVPAGWTVEFQNDTNMGMTDGNGSYAYAYTGTADPSTAAGDLLAGNIPNLLPADNYTQLQTTDIQPLQPFGSVVSFAGMGYRALWVDNQGSVSLEGRFYVAVRQDGLVLAMLLEALPVEAYEGAAPKLSEIMKNTFGRFGGLA